MGAKKDNPRAGSPTKSKGPAKAIPGRGRPSRPLSVRTSRPQAPSKDEEQAEGLQSRHEIRQLRAEIKRSLAERTAQIEAANKELRTEIRNRKKAESALKRSEEKYRTLVENLNVGVYRTTPGPKGRFVEANRALIWMCGYQSREEFLKIHVADLYHDPSGRKRFSDRLRTLGAVIDEELKLKRKDGTSFWGSSTAIAVYDEHARIKFFDGIIEDIRERKRAEEALHQLHRKIANLSSMEQQHLGRDLHDNLGQQLTGMALLTKSLQQKLNVELPAEAAKAAKLLSVVHEAQGQVCALMKGLLPVELDATGLMSALEELAVRSTEIFWIPYQFQCRAPVSIEDNNIATQLFHIAQEAINNAARHGRPGKIVVVLNAKDREGLTLQVRDDGKGLPSESQRPAGMGFRIMRYPAEVIGADLTIESRRDGGATVTCILPQDGLDERGED